MSYEKHKINPDQLSDVIIYTKSKQNSSQSASSNSNSNSINKKSNSSRNKKSKKEENKSKSDYKSIKSLKNSINSNVSLNSKYKTLENHNRTLKSKKEEGISTIDDKDQQEDVNDMNCRQIIKRFFENNNKINYVQTVIYFISFLSFTFYVICTYIDKLFKYLNYIDYFICPIYMVGHIINILIAHQPFNYLTSGDSIIYFILEIPPLLSSLCDNFTTNWLYKFINFTRVMRIMKVVNLIDTFVSKEISDVTLQIITIISNLVMLILLLGGTIQIFDFGYVDNMLKITHDTLSRKNLLLRRYFHHYIYFSIVTLTTVGYGDIVPKEILSKIMVIIIAIFMLFYIPQQIDKLLTLSNNQTVYERKKYIFTENVPFVVLIGDIQLESLKSFCQEYFHKDHGDNLRQIVILMNDPPSKNMEHFLNYKDNSKFITYLQGKYNEDDDLIRAGILHSKTCIIFTNKKTFDSYSADYQSLILSLSIKKFFCYNNEDKVKKTPFKICLQLNKQENCQHYFIALQDKYKKDMPSDILFVIESFKMNLLSKSCLTPGIISLISNLVISSGYKKISSTNESDWMKEYIEGQQYEIYKYNSIRGELLFLSFQGIAQELYMKFHAILIALEINYKGGSLIKLNPQSKENIIDIIYSSLLSKTKNTSLNDDYNINQEDQEGDSFLDIYGQASDDELESNYRKMYNLNFKHLEINLYVISSDESIIGNIKRLDEKKDINLDNPEANFGRQNSYLDKISRSNKKVLLTRKMTRIRYVSDGEDDFSNDEAETNSVKHLIDMEENAETYENEFLNDYYTIDDLEKYDPYSNGILNQGIRERNDIKNHIVICGMHPELIQFILPLRSKYLPIKLLKWIVILTPNLPQEIHDTLSKFPKIIFIQGDPLSADNLMRANIMTADIAIILGAYSNMDNDNDNYEIIGRENDEKSEEKKEESNANDGDDLIEDAKVLYIYKSIKKLNSSIQIITELLHTSNIELLLSSKSLKKLYNDSKNIHLKNSSSQTQISDENDYKSNLNYDITPVYAAGEVYLPTVVDRITSQISYNSNLLTILNLILIGEKPPEKAADKKLTQLIGLSGSNLFLIPSEQRSESFNDMFKRLLIKYSMISIALYRKNEQENFYYVYTNPKKTTLVRKNDMVFVLSSTENLVSYYEKNLFIIDAEGKIKNNENEEEKSSIRLNSENNINDESNLFSENNRTFSKAIKEAVEHQIQIKNENKKLQKLEKQEKKKSVDSINNNVLNLFDNKEQKKKKYNSVFNKNEKKRGKYSEIDGMQHRLDKGIEKLKLINDKCNNIYKDVEKFVKEEISSEFSVYISNNINNNTFDLK